jgi:hypothetical protein
MVIAIPNPLSELLEFTPRPQESQVEPGTSFNHIVSNPPEGFSQEPKWISK